ncbi:hypothetical protein GGI23_006685 [Coemansia sp. RSA 2559]|nr:hypothetical protein GGI23_006685 [Coemansia sp. RSA 2559]
MLRKFQGLLRASPALPASKLGSARVSSLWFHTSQARHIVPRTTHYAILGVRENANAQEIKSAYYNLSKRWHPDTNRGATEEAHKMFLKISEAYSVLGNDQRRKDYDRTLLRAGGPSRRTDGFTSPGSPTYHHRYRNASSAFSSSGEYSSAKRSEHGSSTSNGGSSASGYRRPQGTYARHSSAKGPHTKSSFMEWERKHYWELKQNAAHIDVHVRESARQNKYINWQISIYKLWEILTAFTVVFAVGWGGKHIIYYSNSSALSTKAESNGGDASSHDGSKPGEK